MAYDPCLHASVLADWYDMVRGVLTTEPHLARSRDPLGNTPLHTAAQRSSAPLVNILILTWPGAMEQRNRRGDTPMHVAVEHANVAAIRLLADADPKTLRTPNAFGNTPLHVSAATRKRGCEEALRLLYDLAPDVATTTNQPGDTPLHRAIRSSNLTAVTVLSGCREAMRVRNCDGHLPVQVALYVYRELLTGVRRLDVACGQARDVLLHLLTLHRQTGEESLSRLCETCKDPMLPLHVAAQLGHEDLARLIMEDDSTAATRSDEHGSYAIHHAALGGATGMIAMLLEAAPHLASAVTEAEMATPLHLAAECHCGKAVELLLEAAPLAATALTTHGWTPTHTAAVLDNCGALDLLLSASPASAEIQDVEGRTPVRSAAWYDNEEVVKVLMCRAPHTASTRCEDGFNALHAAAEQGFDGVVSIIVRHRPDLVTVPTRDGFTALHLSMQPEYDEDVGTRFKLDSVAVFTVRALLEADPSCALLPSPGPHDSCLPIHLAASLGMDGCVEELLRAAPESVRAVDSIGNTPLECALLSGHWSTVRRIIRAPGQDHAAILHAIDLHRADEDAVPPLFVETVMAHVPLSHRCWALVPHSLPGLLEALPAVVRRGTELDMRELVGHLVPADRQYVTAAVTVLRHHLPSDLMKLVLSKCV